MVLLLGALGTWAMASGLPGRAGDGLSRGFYAVTARAGFTVQNIMVEGRIHTDPAVILQAVALNRGDPIFAFKPEKVKETLEHESWIKTVKVERRLPDTLFISLNERRPAALWQNKGKLRLIDDEGAVLTDQALERFSSLLIVVGEDAPGRVAALNDLLKGEPSLRTQVEAATLAGGRRWDLRLKNGITVRLPEDDPGLALSRLAKAQRTEGILDKDLTAVDLRDGDRIIVATRPGAAQAYTASSGTGDNI